MCAGEIHCICDEAAAVRKPCQLSDPCPTLLGEGAHRTILDGEFHRTHPARARLTPERISHNRSSVWRPGNSGHAKEWWALAICEDPLAAAGLVCYHQICMCGLQRAQ